MDYGHELTDKELKKLEKRIAKEYDEARKAVKKKAVSAFKKYEEKYEKQKALYKQGLITSKEFKEWRKRQLAQNNYFSDLQKILAEDCANANAIALGIIHQSNIDVYALNMNYGTYEIESGLNINTSFSLYDHATVEQLIKNGDAGFMPVAKQDIPKDLRWNRKHVASQITQGILAGDSIPQISKRLQSVTDMNQKAAVRNARTYTTAAENAGRTDSYRRAQDLGIEVKQQWIATPDARVRDSHALLDGEIVEVGQKFSNGLRYPADPTGAPEEVYNCRCTLVAALDGMDNDVNDLNNRFSRLEDGVTYDEWKEMHGAEKAGNASVVQIPEVKQEPPKTFAERIKAIIGGNSSADGSITTDTVYKAGEEFKKEVDAYLKTFEVTEEEKQELLKLADAKEVEYELILKQINDLDNTRNEIYRAWLKDDLTKLRQMGFETKIAAVKEHSRLTDVRLQRLGDLDALRKEIDRHRVDALWGKYREGNLEHAEWMKKKISEIRAVGGVDRDTLNEHLCRSKSPVKKSIMDAYECYPKDWVEASIDYSWLQPKKTRRGYYSEWEKVIAISGGSEEHMFGTSIHELGHRMERVIPAIKDKESEFYNRRTDGEDLVWLGAGYDKDEVTRKDQFISQYMGKDYGGSAYELVSMGFQYAYIDPQRLAKDEDMQKWILGMLLTL